MFRVRIWTPDGAMVRAYSQPTDVVSASSFCSFMRGRGHRCDLIEDTRSLTRHVAELAKKYPASLILGVDVPGHVVKEGGCDG